MASTSLRPDPAGSATPSPRFVVAQKGVRERYLAARALCRRGQLARLVLDFYPPFGGTAARWLRDRGWGGVSRAFGRACDEIPRARIESLPLHAAWDQWQLRRAAAADRMPAAYAAGGRDFALRVAGLEMPPHEVFFSYSSGALEALLAERTRGVLTVLDQIDPGPLEYEIVAAEARDWPEYTQSRWRPLGELEERIRREWEVADTIVVNSEWSREAIVAKGADPARIEVVPLAFEGRGTVVRRAPPPPLRVVWLGRVVLQKGIQYLVEAARRLQREPVEFHVAGESDVPERTRREAPRNVRWLGKLPPPAADALLASGHVFALPTLSDGFALTQLEALAHGLPVITTARCGRVVEDGRTGLLIPPRDPEALATAVMRFLAEPGLSAEMAPACVAALGRYTVDGYGARLASIVERRLAGRSA